LWAEDDVMNRQARFFALIAACASFGSLGGCGVAPPVRSASCMPAVAPTSDDGGTTHRLRLSVLTYNIEGLGWPARKNRGPLLTQIGERLDAMRRAGVAPDIILFQEVFSGAAKRAVTANGYPALAAGPRRTTPSSGPPLAPLPGNRMLSEIGVHLTGSGLVIASRFPIVAQAQHAFGPRACAGRDCLANKGIMLARIALPGLPVPIDIYNTHMNSRGASGAPEARHVAAHERQSLAASRFIDRTHDDAAAVIFGGDFNMRHSEERWENFTRYQALTLVHAVCADPRGRCDVRMSWDGDAPWMDTQDLQFFASGDGVAMAGAAGNSAQEPPAAAPASAGATVDIRPIRVEAMFDGGPDSPRLSDHDGFLVTYELSWRGTLQGRVPRYPTCGAP
jgi:endonuclease/exonuclease/phosphatase family metal-dependent hydrolase